MLIQNSKEQPEAQGEQTKPKVRIHKKHHPEKRKSFVVEDLKALKDVLFSVSHELCLKPHRGKTPFTDTMDSAQT